MAAKSIFTVGCNGNLNHFGKSEIITYLLSLFLQEISLNFKYYLKEKLGSLKRTQGRLVKQLQLAVSVSLQLSPQCDCSSRSANRRSCYNGLINPKERHRVRDTGAL